MPQLAIRIPGTWANDAAAGTVAVSNPTKAVSFNDDFATSALTTGQTTQYLKGTGCNFDAGLDPIQTTDTIDGIAVGWDVKDTADSGELTITESKLIKAGTISGNNTADSRALQQNTFQGGSDRIDWFGGWSTSTGRANSLWGLSFTGTDIRNSGFGACLRVASTGSRTASFDSAVVAVYYTRALEAIIVPSATSVMTDGVFTATCYTSGFGAGTPKNTECAWRFLDDQGAVVNLTTITDPRTGASVTGQSRYLGKDQKSFCAVFPLAGVAAGTYTLECKLTQRVSGVEFTDTATQTITVTADTRTLKTVGAAGCDYTTMANLRTALNNTPNIRVQLKADETHSFGTGLNFDSGCDNWIIEGANATTSKVSWGTGASDYILQVVGASNFVVRNFQTANVSGHSDASMFMASGNTGTDILFSGITIDGVTGYVFLIGAGDVPTGVAVVNCDCVSASGTFLHYFVYNGFSNHLHVLGNTSKPNSGHIGGDGHFRSAGIISGSTAPTYSYGLQIAWNDFDGNGTACAGLRLDMNYVTCRENYGPHGATGNSNTIALSSQTGSGDTTCVHTGRVEANETDYIACGGREVAIVNNICDRVQLTSPAQTVDVVNNTGAYTASQSALYLSGAYLGLGSQYHVANNLWTRVTAAASGQSVLDAGTAEAFSLRDSCHHNIHSRPDTAANGMVYMTDSSLARKKFRVTGGGLDGTVVGQSWGATDALGNTLYEDLSASDDYLVPSGSRYDADTDDAAIRDYRGVLRDFAASTWAPGATGTELGSYGGSSSTTISRRVMVLRVGNLLIGATN